MQKPSALIFSFSFGRRWQQMWQRNMRFALRSFGLSKQQIVYSAEFGRMPQAEAELKGTAATFRHKPSAALGLNEYMIEVKHNYSIDGIIYQAFKNR